ncbi:MAG: MFS transporter [Bacilli bacterium]|nr:MFS transporter [Bacilli bacterium]MDY5745601.1 MFS transporter [Bacilli bacterium]
MKGKKAFYYVVIIYLVRYFGDSLFYNFLNRYYYYLGFSSFELSVLLALLPLMAVISNLVLSKVANSNRRNFILLLIWSLLEGLGICGFFFAKYFVFVLLLDIVCFFCTTSYYNLLDTFGVKICEVNSKSFSSIRVFGTIGYILGTFLGGIFIKNLSYEVTFLIGGSLYLLTCFLLLGFKFIDFKESEEKEVVKIEYKKIFSNKCFIYYFIFGVILISINNSSDSLYGLFTASIGVKDDIFGYFSSATVAIEAILLFLTSFFKRKRFFLLLSIGLIAEIVKLVFFSIPNMNEYYYLSAQLLRGITFGSYLASNVALLMDVLNEKYFSSGLFILTSMQQLVLALINNVSPHLVNSIGYNLTFLILLTISASSSIFLILARKNYNKIRQG